ncbi:MAG: hypothetical protein JNM76_15255 [Betaproteobacteria bacterium]|nr:hypothetical protein [Betaproteobacteria bacterium]
MPTLTQRMDANIRNGPAAMFQSPPRQHEDSLQQREDRMHHRCEIGMASVHRAKAGQRAAVGDASAAILLTAFPAQAVAL